jgi:transcriptional regulator with XRE-family HTH domain
MHIMQLASYLETPGVTAADLARKCGVATSTITRVAQLKAKPSVALLLGIETHTGGAVPAQAVVDSFKQIIAEAE